jgi:hypothetical protein
MSDSQTDTLPEEDPPSTARPRQKNQPGPVYDTAMRWLAERDPTRMSQLLGIPVTGTPQILPADFPVGKLSVDLLLRVAPLELAHVEYTVEVTSDLVSRMMIYRG